MVSERGEEGREEETAMAKDKSTGFVVKLYQMVNGAPDDVLSVSSFSVDVLHFCNCIWVLDIEMIAPDENCGWTCCHVAL